MIFWLKPETLGRYQVKRQIEMLRVCQKKQTSKNKEPTQQLVGFALKLISSTIGPSNLRIGSAHRQIDSLG